MKVIKQNLFTVTISRPTREDKYFSVEANDMQEALDVAKNVIEENYKEWTISAITLVRPCFKRSTKTITVEV